MPFKKIERNAYATRQWALFGPPGVGKSTFAAQLRGPILVVDADHRFSEVIHAAKGDVFTLDNASVDVEAIAAELKANMPNSGIKSIVIDSLTAIISPLIAQAVMDNDANRNKNKVASFKGKAMAMRLLQDSITGWGADTLWIYHVRQTRDAAANLVEATSISTVELARLRRSLNMVLRVVEQGEKRGVKVEWARRGRYPVTLWDDSGCWKGMPEKLEAAVYDGLSEEEQEEIEKGQPKSFASKDAAIAWGFEKGAFRDAVHAENAYNELKAEKKPKSASEMWATWIADVEERLADLLGDSDGDALFATDQDIPYDDEDEEEEGEEGEENPARERLVNALSKVFGKDAPMAATWITSLWTESFSKPHRLNFDELSTTEQDLLGDYVLENSIRLEASWPKQKAAILQSTR